MFIKAVLRKQKIPFEVRANSFDENIYQKLKEAEQEINSTSKRYSSSEVLKSIDDIIYYISNTLNNKKGFGKKFY